MTKEQENRIVEEFERTHRILKVNGRFYPQHLEESWNPFSKKKVWKYYYAVFYDDIFRDYYLDEKDAQKMLDGELKKALDEDKIIPYKRSQKSA